MINSDCVGLKPTWKANLGFLLLVGIDCQRQHFCLHYKMKRKPQIDADWPFVAWLAIVTGVAAMVTLIQTRPELLPLLLWSARQPM